MKKKYRINIGGIVATIDEDGIHTNPKEYYKALLNKQDDDFPIPICEDNGKEILNLKLMEKVLITTAIRVTKGRQDRAAKLCGISPAAINRKITNFKITHPTWKKNVEKKIS